MRMPGLCKVEMSGSTGRGEADGTGAHCLGPARAGWLVVEALAPPPPWFLRNCRIQKTSRSIILYLQIPRHLRAQQELGFADSKGFGMENTRRASFRRPSAEGSGSGRRPVVLLTLWTACLKVGQARKREGCLASRDSIHFILPRGCKRNCVACAFFCGFAHFFSGKKSIRRPRRQVRGARQSLVPFQLNGANHFVLPPRRDLPRTTLPRVRGLPCRPLRIGRKSWNGTSGWPSALGEGRFGHGHRVCRLTTDVLGGTEEPHVSLTERNIGPPKTSEPWGAHPAPPAPVLTRCERSAKIPSGATPATC